MTVAIPSSADVRAALKPLTRKQIRELGTACGVSFHTIYKIQRGEIRQPNIDTVRSLVPHLDVVIGAGSHEGGDATTGGDHAAGR